MAAALGRVVTFPARAAGNITANLTRVTEEPGGVVDDWGRDPSLVRAMMQLADLRWDVTVGGDQHLPRRAGALIVVNTRRFALVPIFSAFAISTAIDRPVRFVGRSDIAPFGPFARAIGGLLDHPDEVAGALHAGEVVILGAEPDERPAGVGQVDHTIVGAALATGVKVYPTATSSSLWGRHARVEIGNAARQPRHRRGPLAELELADRVRADIGALLDEFGETRFGPSLDWLPLGGLR